MVGSPSEPVSYTLTTLFDPAVTNCLPLGVYVRKVGPEGSVWAYQNMATVVITQTYVLDGHEAVVE